MKPDTATPSFTRAVRPQVIMSCSFFTCAITAGMSVGHSAVLLPELKSSNSSLYIDEDMGSWIASVYAIVAPLGCVVGGLSIDIWGRKKVYIIGNIFLFLGWLLIVSAQNGITILIGRTVEGTSITTLATTLTAIMDEVLDPKFRGSLICGDVTTMYFGIILISSLGTFLHWRMASGVATLFAFLSLLLTIFVRESPIWLFRKKQKQRAEDVLRYLWGPGKESEVRRELADLAVKLHLEDVHESSSICRKLISLGRLIVEPHVLKPFLILHFFNLIQVFCGLNLFTYYSIDMLSQMKNGEEILNENVTTIVISIVRTLTIFSSCFVILHIGRRKICIASGLFSSFFAFSLGFLLLARYMNETPLINNRVESYITLISIIMFAISMSFGFSILPAIMIGETQASCIRGFACGYIYAINDLVLGGVVKVFPWLMSTLQIHGIFLMFAISCAICTIFVCLFLPETKGQPLQEIEAYFRQSNILWITRKTTHRSAVTEETGEESNGILLKNAD